MFNQKVCWLFVAVVALSASLAWALGFQLGESKDELKLKYDVAVDDHGTGRVTVVVSISDQGRLKPLDSVDLSIPAEGKSGMADLSLSLAASEENGKQVVRVHLLKEWAKRAEILLKTHHIDGKQEVRTWYYHSIPIAGYLKDK
jgi:hypothetical protein